MPVIKCPNCNRYVYAYPLYDEFGAVVAVRCSVCYNVYNIDQVVIVPFPNHEIVLKATFVELIKTVLGVEIDPSNHEEVKIRMLEAIKMLTKGELRIYENWLFPKAFYAAWSYVDSREAEESNMELEERAQMMFAPAIDKNFVVVEIREMDEGDSIFIAVHPDDVEKLKKALYGFRLGDDVDRVMARISVDLLVKRSDEFYGTVTVDDAEVEITPEDHYEANAFCRKCNSEDCVHARIARSVVATMVQNHFTP